MSDLPRTTISAAAIVNHVLPHLALVIDEAVNAAVGDELNHANIQLESIAESLRIIAAAAQQFQH